MGVNIMGPLQRAKIIVGTIIFLLFMIIFLGIMIYCVIKLWPVALIIAFIVLLSVADDL